ncbi:hypothetical protein ARMSODRAFT_980469 [Armillaria solidipes]|uniref:Uncharacterized protein n=1 Tax=Armillaria solidipes TaxID=1076256 RepID=A0A2H3AVV4_9AGAR|nr:hypothetical protein ARMSODRAFT_980469 [Armillaria solidipes]
MSAKDDRISGFYPPTTQTQKPIPDLRESFHQKEQALYMELGRTPVERLNDVQRRFLKGARGALEELEGRAKVPLTADKNSVMTVTDDKDTIKPAGDKISSNPDWWGDESHVLRLAGDNVIVREDDWGSVIAWCLSSLKYQRELEAISSYHPPSSFTAKPPIVSPALSTSTSSSTASFFSAVFRAPTPAPEWHMEDHELHVCRKDVGVVLYGKMTDTEVDDPAACTGLAVLDSAVNGDTSAENGSSSVGGEVLRDWGDVADIGDDVFGEAVLALHANDSHLTNSKYASDTLVDARGPTACPNTNNTCTTDATRSSSGSDLSSLIDISVNNNASDINDNTCAHDSLVDGLRSHGHFWTRSRSIMFLEAMINRMDCVTEDACLDLTARWIPIAIKHVPSVRTPQAVKAAELFANDDHLMDEGSQDNEETDRMQPPSSLKFPSLALPKAKEQQDYNKSRTVHLKKHIRGEARNWRCSIDNEGVKATMEGNAVLSIGTALPAFTVTGSTKTPLSSSLYMDSLPGVRNSTWCGHPPVIPSDATSPSPFGSSTKRMVAINVLMERGAWPANRMEATVTIVKCCGRANLPNGTFDLAIKKINSTKFVQPSFCCKKTGLGWFPLLYNSYPLQWHTGKKTNVCTGYAESLCLPHARRVSSVTRALDRKTLTLTFLGLGVNLVTALSCTGTQNHGKLVESSAK